MKSVKKIIVGLAIVSLVAVFYGCGSKDNEGIKFKEEQSILNLEKNYKSLDKYDVVIGGTEDRNQVIEEIETYKANHTSGIYYGGSKRCEYYGKLVDGKPSGEGLLFQNGRLLYAGNFNDGSCDGFGISYGDYGGVDSNLEQLKVVYPSYVGYFKDGEWSGKGNHYKPVYYPLNDIDGINNEYEEKNKEKIDEVTQNGDFTSLDLPMEKTWLEASGEMKNNTYWGRVKTYYENGNVKMDGEYVDGILDGEGIQYYPNGKVEYKGEFRDNAYNGKGKLYNKDGSLNYKGEFRYGSSVD